MVTGFGARTSTVFGAVADPTRRAILDVLRTRDLSAGELADRFPVSRPAISRHLRVLRLAGLVQETKQAQTRIYSLNPEPLQKLDKWVARYRVYWGARLHDLKRFVEGTRPAHATKPKKPAHKEPR
jgi:DNA-binding transcriptional ArsR family regulator